MTTLTVTPAQIQNFIYLLDDAPALLQDFYLENYDKVFEKKGSWIIKMNTACEKWLRKELKSYIKHLNGEIKECKNLSNEDSYWIDEAQANKNRIKLAQRVIRKLN